MPDQFSSHFEHALLEADITRLAESIEKQKENPESKGISSEELVKKSIQTVFPQAEGIPAAPLPDASPLPAYAQTAAPAVQLEIERLIDVAFHKGIAEANKEASRSSPFVLDAFHDALAGKLYPEFLKRGILK